MTKRKPMKRERAYVVVDAQTGKFLHAYRTRRWARDTLSDWGIAYDTSCYVQPVDIIPAKGRKG